MIPQVAAAIESRALLLSALDCYGQDHRLDVRTGMSAFGSKADRPFCVANVCF